MPPRTDVWDQSSILAVVEEACALYRGQVAIRAEDGDRTFAQVWASAQAVNADLRRAGVRPGHYVGLWATKSADLLAGVIGVLAAGAVYVPLDPTYGPQRLGHIVEDAKPVRVVVPVGFVTEADQFGVPLTVIRRPRRPSPVTPAGIDATSAAYLIFTSGSTGKPKGVIVEHRSLLNLLRGLKDDLELRPGDVFIGTAPIAFDASVPNLLLPLVTGATLSLPPAHVVTDPHAIAALVDELDANVLKCSNSVLRMLCEIDWPGRPGIKVVTGGESLPRAVAEKLLPRVGQLWNHYGPTEATVCATRALVALDDTDPVPIGWPLPGVDHLVLDPHLEPVQPGQTGELWISGLGVARGYLHDEARTAERFVELAIGGGPRVRGYRTGDMVRQRPDGALVMLGRTDDQVKHRGYRIELAEIDNRIAEHPDVLQAVTVLQRNGRGDGRLVAFVQAASDAADVDDIRALAERLLPAYMVPSLIVPLDGFPLTSVGKIDRARLAELEVTPSVGHIGREITDPTQRKVAEIFATVLDLPVEQMRASDDFFALGGQSVRAVELMGLIVSELQARLPLSTLMTYSTVEALAGAVRASLGGVVRGPLVQLKAGSSVPLFCIATAPGDVLSFRDFVAGLPESQTVYGLEMIGADRAVPCLYDLDEIVDRYLAEVRAVCPDGPYRFAGSSLGGIIAYLMAARLEEQGQATELVALLDAGPPPQLLRGSPVGRPVQSPSAGWRTRLRRSRSRTGDVIDLVRYRSWCRVVMPLWVKRNRIPPRVLHNPDRVLMNSLAELADLPLYHGRVVQWWGQHEDNVPVDRMTAAWNRVICRGLEVRTIDGLDVEHVDFLKGRSGRWVIEGLVNELSARSDTRRSSGEDVALIGSR